MSDITINLLRCPKHGYQALEINETRVTYGKCCGSWKVAASFRANRTELVNVVESIPSPETSSQEGE